MIEKKAFRYLKNKDELHKKFRYEAAQKYRADGISVPLSINGDSVVKKDRSYMVRINRDLHMNNPIYKSIINSLVTNVLGQDGAQVIWHNDNESDKDWLNEHFKLFSRDADYTNRFSLTDLERIILQEMLITGEILLLKKRKTLQIQLIESERIKTVNVDKTGTILSFDIYSNIISTKNYSNNSSETITIQAKDAIYIYNPERYSSSRGIGVLWSACDLINTESYILRSSAKAMGIAARHVISIEKDDGEQQMANYTAGLAGTSPAQPSDDDTTEISPPAGMNTDR